MKKILFVNDELRVGGVTTVLFNLLNSLDKTRYQIDLLILNENSIEISDIPNNVRLIQTSDFFDVCDVSFKECIKGGPFKTLKKLYMFALMKTGFINQKITKERKKIISKKYDVEIAFKEGICSVFVANSNCENILNWIHSDYKVKNYSKNYMGTMKKIYSKFNTNVAVSNAARDSFASIFELNNVVTIHNIINTNRIEKLLKENVEFKVDSNFSLVTVGRLHPQKSYDRLLNVVSELNKKYKFSLYIIGDGPLKDQLFEQKNKLKLDNVHFLLNQSNPFKYLKQCDLFVLSSLYEGLPTVVYESFLAGVPVITTKVAGVEEQINEENGVIVENNEEDLYKGISYLLDNKDIVEKMKKDLSTYKYENSEILEEIYKLLEA